MPERKYQRRIEELHERASLFWPSEVSEAEAKLSIIPFLLKTQEQFITILSVEVRDIERLFALVENSTLPANLFLKHLVILADFGGEMLKRVSNEFVTVFPEGKLNYYWQGKQRSYNFKALPEKKLSNVSLQIDGKNLIQNYPLSNLHKDTIALLLFGSSYSDDNEEVPSALSKCQIGDYLGKPDKLNTFIKQRYIWVSRIIGGAQANNLGQIAQKFVANYINNNLRISGIEVKPNCRIPGVSHTDPTTGRLTAFDLVVSDGSKYVAVEVSFQVTTNSTIERKGGQARSRFEQINRAGHKIAYVIDGAGNFERETAVKTICSHSHCTVAFSHSELDVLCDFLREYFI